MISDVPGEHSFQSVLNYKQILHRVPSTILDKKLDGTPCHMAEKRLLLPPFPLFNVAVMLSRTLTHMLTYNIDLGDGEEKWPYRTDKVLQVNS